MPRPAGFGLVSVIALLAVGCVDRSSPTPKGSPPAPAEPPPAQPSKASAPAVPPPAIEVRPAVARLLGGEPGLQFVVQGTGPHGGRTDLTRAVAWKLEPAGVVAVDAEGYLRPLKAGRARVEARSGKSIAVAEVTVDPAGARAWDFAEDIEPVLTRSGCNTGGCHGRGDGQNGFHLSLFGYDPEGDHRALTRDVGERRLSTFRPESSLFVAKATGAIPHVGGPRLRPGSDEYQTVLGLAQGGRPVRQREEPRPDRRPGGRARRRPPRRAGRAAAPGRRPLRRRPHPRRHPAGLVQGPTTPRPRSTPRGMPSSCGGPRPTWSSATSRRSSRPAWRRSSTPTWPTTSPGCRAQLHRRRAAQAARSAQGPAQPAARPTPPSSAGSRST